jgi:hypothetical protein
MSHYGMPAERRDGMAVLLVSPMPVHRLAGGAP